MLLFYHATVFHLLVGEKNYTFPGYHTGTCGNEKYRFNERKRH